MTALAETHGLIKYDEACRALSAALTIDEVKEIKNISEAARAYAKQAKNRGMEMDAMEIRTRAERRLGEILLDLRKEAKFGYGGVGRSNGRLLSLEDLGVDKNISGVAQRLAMLSVKRFDQEIKRWRDDAAATSRMTAPLQRYRKPSAKDAHERKRGRRVEEGDSLGGFKAPDGRRVVDWRVGELPRLAETFRRMESCVAILMDSMPVVDDQLATIEMIFDRDLLVAMLGRVWRDEKTHKIPSAAQAISSNIAAANNMRTCKGCGKSFNRRNISWQARALGQFFCSVTCGADHD